MSNKSEELHLEPRVARLETGLESLTKNVSDLANTIRDNNLEVSKQLSALQVSVTTASGPRKTEWSLLLSGGFLILALGSAVFWPLNKATLDNKSAIEMYHSLFVDHEKLELHPVGMAKVAAMTKEMDNSKSEFIKRDTDLDAKIQMETRLMTDLISSQLIALDKRLQIEMGLKNDVVLANQRVQDAVSASHMRQDELENKRSTSELKIAKDNNDLYINKLFDRVTSLEQRRINDIDNEHTELMQWRQKAMGLSSPNSTVPLTSKEILDIKK